MCKVRKIHLLAINGLLWLAIGTKIAITGVCHYLQADPGKLWWMISASVLVSLGISLKHIPGIPEPFFAWFYLGLGPGLVSAGVRFLIRGGKGRKDLGLNE